MKNALVGQIVLVRPGNKNKQVAFDKEGKAIIPHRRSRNIQNGWAKITRVIVDKQSFYVVDLENVDYDYYPKITRAQFKSVLKNIGFTKIEQTPIYEYMGLIIDDKNFIYSDKVNEKLLKNPLLVGMQENECKFDLKLYTGAMHFAPIHSIIESYME